VLTDREAQIAVGRMEGTQSGVMICRYGGLKRGMSDTDGKIIMGAQRTTRITDSEGGSAFAHALRTSTSTETLRTHGDKGQAR
jgi:hypothetical protein